MMRTGPTSFIDVTGLSTGFRNGAESAAESSASSAAKNSVSDPSPTTSWSQTTGKPSAWLDVDMPRGQSQHSTTSPWKTSSVVEKLDLATPKNYAKSEPIDFRAEQSNVIKQQIDPLLEKGWKVAGQGVDASGKTFYAISREGKQYNYVGKGKDGTQYVQSQNGTLYRLKEDGSLTTTGKTGLDNLPPGVRENYMEPSLLSNPAQWARNNPWKSIGAGAGTAALIGVPLLTSSGGGEKSYESTKNDAKNQDKPLTETTSRASIPVGGGGATAGGGAVDANQIAATIQNMAQQGASPPQVIQTLLNQGVQPDQIVAGLIASGLPQETAVGYMQQVLNGGGQNGGGMPGGGGGSITVAQDPELDKIMYDALASAGMLPTPPSVPINYGRRF